METLAGVKPKVEPCEEPEHSPPLPPPASDDCEVTPLSGDNPFFTIVMSRTQVQHPFQLAIPVRFHRHLPEARAAAVLRCRGRSWTVSYRGDCKFKSFDTAWRDFALGNALRVGDACVFELIMPSAGTEQGGCGGGSSKELVFRVQVLRGGLPEEITSRGATADDPLVVVD
ncbi:hypothetical protein U9M48_029656 [Paspalum notatum var. saurae]|uniref:TF-B3 domain-containing protein n=1 Tax=Paspalum notatum var. saurae TaxID=547442 RepID=A0AAQ3U1E2_PASNO